MLLKILFNLSRFPQIYDSVNPGLDRELRNVYHDSLYNAAKRCAFLPSLLHINEVKQTTNTLVTGGGFADVHKGETDDGLVVALKIPRNFGTNEQIRKVHAVGRWILAMSLILTKF